MSQRCPHGPLGASNSRLHGFLTSVVSGPIVLPPEWLPVVFGDDDERAWESIDDAHAAIALLMRLLQQLGITVIIK